MSSKCDGHPCDGCARCVAGQCCGEDVAEPDLPRQGSWGGQMHGQIGVLLEKGGKVQCHVCGDWYVELGRHLTRHRMSADEYRAYFGLACGRALCPAWLSEQRSKKAKGEGLGRGRTQNVSLTREQRSLISYRREQRAETAIKRQKQLAAIAQAGAQARWAATRPQSPDPVVRLRRHAAGSDGAQG